MISDNISLDKKFSVDRSFEGKNSVPKLLMSLC